MDTSNEAQDDIEDDSDSNEQANPGVESQDDSPTEISVSRPANTRASLHVSVQRNEIAPAQITEGSDELQGLDVDVYDQQTYERSVFNQVDKAITDVSSPPASQQTNVNTENGIAPNNNINDLMRLIQDGEQEQLSEQLAEERDEQILLLARQQRLNRVNIKREVIEPTLNDDQPSARLPRCPRIQRIDSSQPSTSRSAIGLCKQETPSSYNIHSAPLEELDSSDEGDSSCSEYIPSKQDNVSEDDDDDDEHDEHIDYETEDDDYAEPSKCDSDEDTGGRRVKDTKVRDDGDFKTYARRVKAYTKARAKMRLDNILDDGTEFKKLDELVTIEGSLQIPRDVWDNLYEHQKTGVRWLWELHQLGTGGILGDEMGLGKTIQMIAFLVALKSSNVVNLHNSYDNLGPVVLVCPATVMHQWLVELRKWYPPFRVAILHSTGSFSGDRRHLIKAVHKSNGILICSYPGVVIYQDYLHALDWHYAVLDEGHKIRNPDAQVTLASKRFRTPHRIILSGSPVQNNLRELWSIFDFIYPGKLGTLPVFMGHFGIPITQGGYANASDMQVQIAYKCACVLRDTIKPFLLRRTKAEVSSKLKLPDRSEQVLFCKLTEKQRKAYETYLLSPIVRDIKRGACQIFVGLIQLRKICNHPDLFDATDCMRQVKQTQKNNERQIKHLEFFSTDETYGHYQKSGKMMVVDALLKLWKRQKHKVLLFTQSRQMLKIFTKYLDGRNYKYLCMDGSTPIGARHSMIDSFNEDEEIFVFLLTTRVGGVGVNLIGANRIIIYDPDWNPSTDIQARERAWRIGQKRQVIIYRLLTAGTIEEKIYHRQVFKLYLTNRILKDAKQKRFFKTNDMHELFTLGTDEKNTETRALFDEDLQIDQKSLKKSSKHKKDEKIRKDKRRKRQVSSDENSPEPGSISVLSEDKLREMRERAKRLSQMIGAQYGAERESNGSQSSDLTIRVKLEQNDNEQSNNSFVVTSGDARPIEQDAETENPLSPNEAVPYCPTWGLSSAATTTTNIGETRAEATETTKSKKQRASKSKQRVDYLVKQDVYKPHGEHKTGEDDEYQRDDYILGRLFKNSNISGALKHDKIESDGTPDFKVVQSEAEKVARDAIRVLRESRRMCLGSTYGIPNWTGRNGQVAATQSRLIPKNRVRAQQIVGGNQFAASDDQANGSLLSSIRKRNQVNPISLRANNSSLDSDDDDEQDRDFHGKAQDIGADEMAKKIRNFVLYKSAIQGEAQTDELLGYFKRNFDPKQTAIFKAILYKICELQRRGDKGFWKLKSEFRDL